MRVALVGLAAPTPELETLVPEAPVLANEHLRAGPHARIWQGHDARGRQVSSGAYYVRLEVGGQVEHQKIMLLK